MTRRIRARGWPGPSNPGGSKAAAREASGETTWHHAAHVACRATRRLVKAGITIAIAFPRGNASGPGSESADFLEGTRPGKKVPSFCGHRWMVAPPPSNRNNLRGLERSLPLVPGAPKLLPARLVSRESYPSQQPSKVRSVSKSFSLGRRAATRPHHT